MVTVVVGVPDVYAAGDTAAARTEDGHFVMQSCQHATQLGKTAGRNAVADLFDQPLAAFTTTPYVTCLDLGPAGAVLTTGFDRTVRQTGDAAKATKRAINTVLIYPPTDNAQALLHQADTQPPTDSRLPPPNRAIRAPATRFDLEGSHNEPGSGGATTVPDCDQREVATGVRPVASCIRTHP
jgi:hypothetical protein